VYKDFDQIFGSAQPIRLVLAESIDAALLKLESAAQTFKSLPQVCGFRWTAIPTLERLLDDLVQLMADTALSMWPDWYGLEFDIDASATSNEVTLDLENAVSKLQQTRRNALTAWFSSAASLARNGELPIPTGFSRTLQASQLALAIAPHDLLFVLSAAETEDGRLQGFVAAAEWLTKETGSPAVLLLPLDWEHSPELQRATYGAFRIVSAPSSAQLTGTDERPIVAIVPGLGRPHPNSPGEQQLFEKLARDAELAPLFVFNRTVRMPLGQNYRVDLLWPEGRVVVEVDGLREHHNELAFVRDRERDYRLIVQGYIVLRLPHQQVMEDPELSIEKIRDVVRFRSKHPIHWNDK
jgi:very-short-patch-repair endonuclease